MNGKRDDDYYRVQHAHTRQCWWEARSAAAIWLGTLLLCGAIFYQWGYIPESQRPDVPPTVLGVPAWAFWGLFAPWVLLMFAAWAFAAFVLKDDEPYEDFPRTDEHKRDSGPTG